MGASGDVRGRLLEVVDSTYTKELTAQALETHDHRFATVISVRAAKR